MQCLLCRRLLFPHEFVADLGRVLTAIQVPQEDYAAFDEFLGNLGYHYVEETDNEVYKRCLGGQVTLDGSA